MSPSIGRERSQDETLKSTFFQATRPLRVSRFRDKHEKWKEQGSILDKRPCMSGKHISAQPSNKGWRDKITRFPSQSSALSVSAGLEQGQLVAFQLYLLAGARAAPKVTLDLLKTVTHKTSRPP